MPGFASAVNSRRCETHSGSAECLVIGVGVSQKEQKAALRTAGGQCACRKIPTRLNDYNIRSDLAQGSCKTQRLPGIWRIVNCDCFGFILQEQWREGSVSLPHQSLEHMPPLVLLVGLPFQSWIGWNTPHSIRIVIALATRTVQ